jgi:lysophospholipase L1-like esterase
MKKLSTAVLLLMIFLTGCGGEDGADPQASTSDVTSAPSSAASSPTESASPPAAEAGLKLVAIGDSIPYNSSEDCPGCTGFVDRLATAVGESEGEEVEVDNLSEHNGLTLEMLMDELDSFSEDLADADVILVGIAHNSIELASYTPCGTPADENELPDWSVMTEKCARASAEKYRPIYDELFGTIAGLRQGKPTLLRTVNRYNDWIGYTEIEFTPEVDRKTAMFIRYWNDMLCASAEAHGFGCADLSTAFNGKDGMRPSGDLLGGDYTHPSEKGNELIAQVLTAMGIELTPVA